MNKASFRGTVVYSLSDSTRQRAASLAVTYKFDGEKLQGKMHFRGHESWEADLPLDEPFTSFPEPWQLKAFARSYLYMYMKANSFTYHSSRLD